MTKITILNKNNIYNYTKYTNFKINFVYFKNIL